MSSKQTIDLSCDLGEAVDPVALETEDALWPMITSANVACGGHFGDVETMTRAVGMAIRHGVAIGAHPSYPDRENFGRRSMQMDHDQLRESLEQQIDSLRSIVMGSGARLTHVKPHGALYNDAHKDEALAAVVLDAMRSLDGSLAIVCAPQSAVAREAKKRGLRIVAEGFGDRRYEPNGALVSRSRPDALLLDVDEAAEQVREIVMSGRVKADDSSLIPLRADTICIHSDMTASVERLRAIRAAIERAAVEIRSVHG